MFYNNEALTSVIPLIFSPTISGALFTQLNDISYMFANCTQCQGIQTIEEGTLNDITRTWFSSCTNIENAEGLCANMGSKQTGIMNQSDIADIFHSQTKLSNMSYTFANAPVFSNTELDDSFLKASQSSLRNCQYIFALTPLSATGYNPPFGFKNQINNMQYAFANSFADKEYTIAKKSDFKNP